MKRKDLILIESDKVVQIKRTTFVVGPCDA